MPSTVTLSGPGTATITDDAAAVLTTNLPLLTAQLTRIQGTGANINYNIIELKKATVMLASSVQGLEISIGSLAVASSTHNALMAAMAANQIRTNNFQMQATKEALERTGQPIPEEPPMSQQIEDTMSDSVSMTSIAQTSGAINAGINSSITQLGTWIAQTKAYKTVSSWLSQGKDFIFVYLPDSAKDLASKIAGNAGTPSP
jgi:hypothetical protein